MNSSRIYTHKVLSVLAIVAVLFNIYALSKAKSLTGSALVEDKENEEHGRLAKLPPFGSTSGTVMDVRGQLGFGGTAPPTIGLAFSNEDLPTGLVPGKALNQPSAFESRPIYMDDDTIPGDAPLGAPVARLQPAGLINQIIFFMAYWFL